MTATLKAELARALGGGNALDELFDGLADDTREFVNERDAKLTGRIEALERRIAELEGTSK